jgi:hypothetical protein
MYTDLRNSLEYHLQYNHFPPVDLVFVETALEAIQNLKDNNPLASITMPNGIEKTSEKIIEELHLEFYLEEEEEE